MKRLISITFCLLLFCLCGHVYADTLPFPLLKDPTPIFGTGGGNTGGDGGSAGYGDGGEDDGGDGETPPKGHRAPARPVFCTIDFAAGEVAITGYDVAVIEAFEIWDADRTFCIASAADCADFVADLAETSGTVAVVFYFDGFTLSGYFTR